MKYFLDTEFIEDGETIDLISIGIVAEDGRELYVQSIQANLSKASPWVEMNVLPHLIGRIEGSPYSLEYRYPTTCYNHEIAQQIEAFVFPDTYGKPEFWGYYADYDWVALCQLFGTMMDLPKDWPKFCMDIKQLCVMLGNPKLPEQGKGEHHALADAKWNKEAYEFLMGRYQQGWHTHPVGMANSHSHNIFMPGEIILPSQIAVQLTKIEELLTKGGSK